MNTGPRKSIMQSLGECIGHIVKAIKTDVPAPVDRGPVARTQPPGPDARPHPTQDAPMILRRTIIEEIHLPRPTPPSQGPAEGTRP